MGSASITGISYIDRNDRRNAPKRKPVPSSSSRQPSLTRQGKRDSKARSKDLTFLEPRSPPLSPKPSIIYSSITALPQPGHESRPNYSNDTADRQTLRSLRSQRSARESLRTNFKHFSLGSAYTSNDKTDRKSKRKSVDKSSISRPLKADSWSRPAGAPSLAGSHYRQAYEPLPELQHPSSKSTAYRSIINPTRPLSTLDYPSQRYGTFYKTSTHPNSETSSFTVRIKPQQQYTQPPTARTFFHDSNRNSDNTDETLFSTGTADSNKKSYAQGATHHHHHHITTHNPTNIPEEPELKSEWFSSTSSLSDTNALTTSKRAHYRRLLERVSRKNLRDGGLAWSSAVTSVVGSVTGRGGADRDRDNRDSSSRIDASEKKRRSTRGCYGGSQALAGVQEDSAPMPKSVPDISRPFQGRALGAATTTATGGKTKSNNPKDKAVRSSRSTATTVATGPTHQRTTGFKDLRSDARPPTGSELRDLREKARKMNRGSLRLGGKTGEKSRGLEGGKGEKKRFSEKISGRGSGRESKRKNATDGQSVAKGSFLKGLCCF